LGVVARFASFCAGAADAIVAKAAASPASRSFILTIESDTKGGKNGRVIGRNEHKEMKDLALEDQGNRSDYKAKNHLESREYLFRSHDSHTLAPLIKTLVNSC
jgi:hypothetical protein